MKEAHHLDSTTEEVVRLRKELAVLKQQNEQLRGEMVGLQDLIDSAIVPIVITGVDCGTILYVNKIARSYLPEDRNSNYPKGLPAVDFWADPAQRAQYIDALTKDGALANFQAKLHLSDEMNRQVMLSAAPSRYQGKQVYYTIINDVTERVKAEERLHRSEQQYQEMYSMMKLMADTMPDLIWAKDLEDRFLFGNNAIREKLLMCEEGEILEGKKDIYFAERERKIGHKHTFGEICVNSDQVVKNNRVAARFLEDGLVRGEYLALDVHKAPMFNKDGELIGTVGSGRDVTADLANQKALEESEHRLRLLAENIRDVLWISDPKFRPTYVTPAILELSGYTQDEFVGMAVSEHMTPKFRKKFSAILRMLEALVTSGEKVPANRFEFECIKKDGELMWVEIIATPYYDNHDILRGFTGVIRDSTRRVTVQKHLIEEKLDALAASQTKSEFLANMSHEIRTPMNGVLGFLQLLKGTSLDTSQQHYVETALNSGKSLLSLITDILDFSKIEAGKIELVEKSVSFPPLLHSTIEAFRSLVDSTRVILEYDIADNVPHRFVSDGSRLRQILFNLIGNGVKFTESGSVRVAVEVKEFLADNRARLGFRVVDTGIGIPGHVADRLFEPFIQQDGSFRRKYSGTGLGLTIVKKLVEMMGGTVQLHSAGEGRGTTVLFDIIVKAGDSVGQERLVKQINDNAIEATHSYRILVVEDEKINAMVILAMLGHRGHEVDLANNGLQALKKIEQQDYDCIFMDIQMPEMDGVETTRLIRSSTMNQSRKIPIVALTAHAMQGDRETFLAAGMDDYLSKPIEHGSLDNLFKRLRGEGLL